MPSQRYFNLPEDKKQRILQAVLKELARVPCDEMSINKIVKSANIPRGSFYQYFADKNDLLNYIMLEYRTYLLGEVRKYVKSKKADIFDVFKFVLNITVAYGTQDENFAFCKNMFKYVHLSNAGDFQLSNFNISQTAEEFWGILDHEHLNVQEKSQLVDLLEILALLLFRAIAKIFSDVSNVKQVQERFEKELEMIQYGVYNSGGK